jgi:nucleoside-diphosphate-sugar epimerase
MKILVTGTCGFIGFSLANKLLKRGHQVVGLDNINPYYSIKFKISRLKELKKFKKFVFFKIDLTKEKKLIKNIAANKADVFKIFGSNSKLKKIIGNYKFKKIDYGLNKTISWFFKYNKNI